MSETAKILLVDDDPVMRELASAKLNEAGHSTITAENGAEALDILRNRKVDLVISDIEMPVMDGFELTRRVRETDKIADVPVIVITASDNQQAVDRVFEVGATSFLAKPINWTLFTQAVMFVLRASNAQKDLKKARDQAEAGAKFKDALMSVMSHELRTPLNAIIGFGQLLVDRFEEQSDPVHGEYADYIVDGGKRLLDSVSDMLLASDARSGPLSVNDSDTTVSDVVDSAILQTRAMGADGTPRVQVKLQNPEQEIRCDRKLIAKALSKLIGNAIKFTPDGAEIAVAAALTKSGGLAFMVKDNGPGIPEATLAEMSSPFTQSDMSLKRSKEGLGLGLPMAKAIAAAHKAKFKLNSQLGEGTQAVIVLPPDRVVASRRSSKSAA